MSTPTPPARGFDPEAEQEVDFAKYVRLLAIRWWLLAAGLVLGAIVGYIVSIGGGTQVYSATATIYLGQPYSVGGNSQVFGLQTTPSAVATLIKQQVVDTFVAKTCKTKESQFRKGISSAAVSGSSSSTGSSSKTANLLTTISVQARKAKVAQCAANQLAKLAVSRLGSYPKGKIVNLEAEIAADKSAIASIQQATSDPSISSTDKLFLTTNLRTDQLDEITATQLLLQAKQIESPSIFTGAAAQKVTARSRRNTVVIAAVIGLILGALAALFWDRGAALLRA